MNKPKLFMGDGIHRLMSDDVLVVRFQPGASWHGIRRLDSAPSIGPTDLIIVPSSPFTVYRAFHTVYRVTVVRDQRPYRAELERMELE